MPQNCVVLETVCISSRKTAQCWKQCVSLAAKLLGTGNSVFSFTQNCAVLGTVHFSCRKTAWRWKQCVFLNAKLRIAGNTASAIMGKITILEMPNLSLVSAQFAQLYQPARYCSLCPFKPFGKAVYVVALIVKLAKQLVCGFIP